MTPVPRKLTRKEKRLENSYLRVLEYELQGRVAAIEEYENRLMVEVGKVMRAQPQSKEVALKMAKPQLRRYHQKFIRRTRNRDLALAILEHHAELIVAAMEYNPTTAHTDIIQERTDRAEAGGCAMGRDAADAKKWPSLEG